MVGLIIFFILAIKFFTSGSTGLTTMIKIFGFYSFFIILFQIMINDKVLMLLQSLLITGGGTAIIKGHQHITNIMQVGTKSTSGFNFGIVVVFYGSRFIDFNTFIAKVFGKINVCIFGFRLIRVHPVTSKQTADNIMLMKQATPHTTPSTPVNNSSKFSFFYCSRGNSPFISQLTSRPDYKSPHPSFIVFIRPAVKNSMLQRINTNDLFTVIIFCTGFIALPDLLIIFKRLQAYRDIVTIIIKQQYAGLFTSTRQTNIINPNMLEGISSTAHGRDIKTFPLRTVTTKNHASGARYRTAG